MSLHSSSDFGILLFSQDQLHNQSPGSFQNHDPWFGSRIEQAWVLAFSFSGRLYFPSHVVLSLYFSTATLPNYRYSFQSTLISPSFHSLSNVTLEILDQFSNQCAQTAFMQAFDDLITGSTIFYTDGSKIDYSMYVGAAIYSSQFQAYV